LGALTAAFDDEPWRFDHTGVSWLGDGTGQAPEIDVDLRAGRSDHGAR